MNLDNPITYKEKNIQKVKESNERLPDQIRQALAESRLIKIPKEYSRVTHVVVNGMGGSNLGSRIIKAALAEELKLPILIEPGYQVPSYVNKNTLYIISSYSGTTEEPLSVFKEVKKRGAKILAITSHRAKNKLEKLIMEENLPGYIFKEKYNPSGQPRLGVGYTIFGTLILMAKAGLYKISIRNIEDIIASMEIWSRELRPDSPARQNQAKKLAQAMYGKILILISGEHLEGNLHVMRNQLNECSKLMSLYLSLPELNHYAMEGLKNPKSNYKNLSAVFFNSDLMNKRVQRRSMLTEQVVKKNKINTINYKLKSNTKLAQSFEMLQLGVWISFYLSILYRVDPVNIPWVDWFKKQLK